METGQAGGTKKPADPLKGHRANSFVGEGPSRATAIKSDHTKVLRQWKAVAVIGKWLFQVNIPKFWLVCLAGAAICLHDSRRRKKSRSSQRISIDVSSWVDQVSESLVLAMGTKRSRCLLEVREQGLQETLPPSIDSLLWFVTDPLPDGSRLSGTRSSPARLPPHPDLTELPMSSSCADIDESPCVPPASVAMLERELLRSPYWSIRQLRCYCRDGHIVVRGSVTTFYLKQLAVAVAAKVAGVGCVQIEVDVPPE